MSLFPVPNIFGKGKDLLLEKAVKTWFNNAKSHLGTLTEINIDSTAKTIDLTLDLQGEATPLDIHIKNYRLFTQNSETFIELTDLSTSRPWLNALLNDYPEPEKRQFKVPYAVKVVLCGAGSRLETISKHDHT